MTATNMCSNFGGKWASPPPQPKDDISMQLKELPSNDIHIALFPNLYKLATICFSIAISTASAEQSLSDMKLIKKSPS